MGHRVGVKFNGQKRMGAPFFDGRLVRDDAEYRWLPVDIDSSEARAFRTIGTTPGIYADNPLAPVS